MRTIEERIKRINITINRKKYITEEKDHWKTPTEFKREGGDCEDFAIAKYFELKKLDININSLRLAYGKLNNTPHMVLLHNEMVLDNTTNEIISIEDRTDFKITYSFNESFLFRNGEVYENNLVIWKDMIKRMENEKEL